MIWREKAEVRLNEFWLGRRRGPLPSGKGGKSLELSERDIVNLLSIVLNTFVITFVMTLVYFCVN
jgi:hypothetical protein